MGGISTDITTKIYAANVRELENEALYDNAYHKVTEERRKKTDSFRFQKDRLLSLGAELLLMHGLKQKGINLMEMNYHSGANGKPYLKGRQDIYFNLSHSEDVAVCAISLWEIGCDIEKISDIRLNIAKKYFCESEYDLIASQKTQEAKREMFFRLWTLKESYIKTTGMGMRMPMNSFCINFNTNGIEVKQKPGYKTCHFHELNFETDFEADFETHFKTHLWKNYKCSVCGFDEKIGTKGGVPFEILNFYDILNDERYTKSTES